mmetsp:Transcript_17141/g.31628  ORF Transcript_17141/g.31628 Transcript_17141/m.31628 type:complete len:202 (+) Transcript_17141:107-712(+)
MVGSTAAGSLSKGASSGAKPAPSRSEPAGEKCRPSSSHSFSMLNGIKSLVFTKSSAFFSLSTQERKRALVCCHVARYLRDCSTAPFGGTERAIVRTPALWQTECKSMISWTTSSALALFKPRSLVPAIMSAKSNGPCSASTRRRPRPQRPAPSSISRSSRPSIISPAVTALKPQTHTSAATSGSKSLTKLSAYAEKARPIL